MLPDVDVVPQGKLKKQVPDDEVYGGVARRLLQRQQQKQQQNTTQPEVIDLTQLDDDDGVEDEQESIPVKRRMTQDKDLRGYDVLEVEDHADLCNVECGMRSCTSTSSLVQSDTYPQIFKCVIA